MSNIAVFQPGAGLPAHIVARQAALKAATADLTSGVSAGFPVLSLKGKNWHISVSGTKTLLTNSDGDPRSSLELVMLKANPILSKTYYADTYVEGSDEKPDCYSNDSIAPAADSPDPQSPKCAICPHNQWGSKISETASKGKACQDVRRMAVAPAGALDKPMLLRVPPASLQELVSYASILERAGLPYAYAVTKISFDTSVAYPKLQFRPTGILNEEQCLAVDALQDDPIVAQITGMVPQAGEYAQPAAAPAKPAPPPEPVLTPEQEIARDLDRVLNGSQPAQAAAVEPTPVKRTRATKAKVEAAVVAPAEVAAAISGDDFSQQIREVVAESAAEREAETKVMPATSAALKEIAADGNLAAILANLDD